MTAYKAHQVARLIEAPPNAVHGYLLYGSDPGQISERVSSLAKRLSELSTPAGEIIRLHDQDLAQFPGRLLTEVQTLPMFGGRKVVCVKAGQHLGNDQLEELFSGQPPASSVIIDGGNLKTGSKLRVFFEQHGALAALPCYGFDAADVAKYIQRELLESGLEIAPEALRQLQDSLGGDQTLARAEVEKLRLYAAQERKVTLEHVEAIVGDAAAMATDDVIAAAFAGNGEALYRQFDRLLASGAAPQSLLIALGSHLFRLHQVRAALDGGEGIETAMRRLKPPVFFKQEDTFKSQCRAWAPERLAAALAMVQETLRQARLRSTLEIELTSRALMLIAMEARKTKVRAGARGR
jgi:DNA polymerase-3 subunit delta